MAVINISEFTFGYAFLYEQTRRNWNNLIAAPFLPSLHQEASVGWDAWLPTRGTDYYYQFKISDYLLRRNARFRADGTYNGPYFRIALHRKDNNSQHRHLWAHSLQHPRTFYVAPEIYEKDRFNQLFLAEHLTENTRLIPLNMCDDINDGDQHYITYIEGENQWIQHSQKKVHELSYFGKDIESLYLKSKESWHWLDTEYAVNLHRETINTAIDVIGKDDELCLQQIESLFVVDEKKEPRARYLESVSKIVSVLYGLTLVFVGEAR